MSDSQDLEAAVAAAMRALLRRLRHHHGALFVTVCASKPAAVATDLGGIHFLWFGHNSPPGVV